MKDWKVYVHINKVNNKRYYGITCQEVERRWRDGKGYEEQLFYGAIEKYGWDNFQHIVIAKGLTEETAKWLEIELIASHNTTDRNFGYNITKGGDGLVGVVRTEETRRKISETLKGKSFSEERKKNISISLKGRTLSEEHKRKMSERMSGEGNPMFGMSGELCPSYGKILTEETKKKISDSKKGKNNPKAISVICLTTKRIFWTVKDGADYYNCQRGHISSCCKGKYKSCGKYNGQKLVWRYLVWEHNKTYRIVKSNKEIA